MQIELLLPEKAVDVWPLVKEPLQKALDHGQGESKLIDYLNGILNYQVQLWVIHNEGNLRGVVLTKFIQYSRHKTLHVIGLSGENFNEWVHLYPAIEDFAKNNGCVAIETWGRPGWSKTLPKVLPGFELAYHVMRKSL
jgi:hypothetical protein